MLPLDLSYDHRVINGADAARFLTRYAALLTNPAGCWSEGLLVLMRWRAGRCRQYSLNCGLGVV